MGGKLFSFVCNLAFTRIFNKSIKLAIQLIVMIIQLEHISKSFGSRVLFSDVSFKLENHDRLALVGPNGAGKTTLLNIISGEEDADQGRILLAKGCQIGYLEQEAIEMGEAPIFEEVLSAQEEICRQEERVKTLEAALGSNPTDEQLHAYGKARDLYESMGGYLLEARVRAVLFGLGFGEDDGIEVKQDIQEEEPAGQERTVTGEVAEIRSSVISGNTWYYFRLKGKENACYYGISAADCPEAVTYNKGDQLTITYPVSEDGTLRKASEIKVK